MPSKPTHLPERLALAVVLGLAALGAAAQQVRVLVQNSSLAGFSHYAAAEQWPALRVGDRLTLAREPDNPHDANAVRVEWQGIQLGYLPRAENRQVAAEMDGGARIEARIAALTPHPDPRRRIRLDIYLAP